jgi:hypothetical protein
MARKGKRHKIDWDNIKVTIVPADKNNPNPLNPCARLSRAERKQEIVSIAARIWVRAMRDKRC